jgi:GT2 family glycosyltransferase
MGGVRAGKLPVGKRYTPATGDPAPGLCRPVAGSGFYFLLWPSTAGGKVEILLTDIISVKMEAHPFTEPHQDRSGAPGPQTLVSVVIPTWKRRDLLVLCLASLRRQTMSDFSIVLVSNGAGKWVEQVAAEYGCALLSFPENRGFAAAVNAGIAVGQSACVLVLNDDVELAPDWLERTTRLLEERSDLAFCTGKIYQSDGVYLDSAGDALSMCGAAWRLGNGRRDAVEFDQPRALLGISGTAALFRRSMLASLGGFDEDYFSYLEDVDLSVRAHRAGYGGEYVPGASATHHGGASSGGPESPDVFRLLTRNKILLLAGNFSLPLLEQLGPRILWAQLLWGGMALRKGLLRPYVSGLRQAVRLLPRAWRKRARGSREENIAMLKWLRQGEDQILGDLVHHSGHRPDTFWRLYFLVFSRSQSRRRSMEAKPQHFPTDVV